MNLNLYQAICNRDVNSVVALLKNGVDPNCEFDEKIFGKSGFTPLHLAASLGFHDVVTALLENKANPNLIAEGYAALSYAATLGFKDVVRVFLNPIYQCDLTLGFPWFNAKINGKDDIAKMLPISFGQDWLLLCLKYLGYDLETNGLCYGIAHMAKYALQLRQIEQFNGRLHLLLNFYLQATSETKDEELLAKAIRQFVEKSECCTDIYAFCDGLALYQDQFDKSYAYLYTQIQSETSQYQKDNRVNRLITPAVFCLQGDAPLYCTHFSGAYTQNDLDIYLQTLRELIRKNAIQEPISLMMVDDGHAINVGYDPKNDKWIFVNSNRLPVVEIDGTNQQITKKIINAFFLNDHAVFATCIYASAREQKKMKQCLKELEENVDWQRIHQVTEKKISLKTHKNISWQEIAKTTGDVKTVTAFAELEAKTRSSAMSLATLGLFSLYKFVTNNAEIELTKQLGKTP